MIIVEVSNTLAFDSKFEVNNGEIIHTQSHSFLP